MPRVKAQKACPRCVFSLDVDRASAYVWNRSGNRLRRLFFPPSLFANTSNKLGVKKERTGGVTWYGIWDGFPTWELSKEKEKKIAIFWSLEIISCKRGKWVSVEKEVSDRRVLSQGRKCLSSERWQQFSGYVPHKAINSFSKPGPSLRAQCCLSSIITIRWHAKVTLLSADM